MKQAWWTAGLAAMIAVGATAQDNVKGQIGKPGKFIALKDAMKDDATVDLAQHKGKDAVVLVWISEKCDITWRYEGRTGELMKDFGDKGVKFYAVWSSAADSATGIKKYAESKNYVMPVLDDAKGELARFYGVAVTPTYVVLDKDGVFRYRGAYDDLQCNAAGFKLEASAAKERYVHSALSAILEGKDVPVSEKRGIG